MRGVFASGLGDVVDLATAVGGAQLGDLGAHVLHHRFLLVDQLRVQRVVAGADDVRALEHHVLEQVGDAGDARALVRRADVGDPAARHRGREMTRHQQHAHAVVEHVLLDRGGCGRLARGRGLGRARGRGRRLGGGRRERGREQDREAEQHAPHGRSAHRRRRAHAWHGSGMADHGGLLEGG
jgi:hypothetical protein